MKSTVKKSRYGENDYCLKVRGAIPKNAVDALNASIAKYDVIVQFLEGRDPKEEIFLDDGGVDTCGCCVLYYDSPDGRCDGCPIYELVGETDCKGTPYYTRTECHTAGKYLRWATREREFLTAVRDMQAAKEKALKFTDE